MNIKKYIFSLIATFLILIPVVASAAVSYSGDGSVTTTAYSSATASSGLTCTTPTDITTLFNYALCLIVGYVTPFLFGLGALIFIIGVLTYVRAGDNEEKRAAGRDLMWFGIIALFVMISVWGFVKILTRSFFGTDPAFQSLPPRATSVFQQ